MGRVKKKVNFAKVGVYLVKWGDPFFNGVKNKSYDNSRSSILSSVDRVLVVVIFFGRDWLFSKKMKNHGLKMAIKNHRSFVFQRKNWFMVLSFYLVTH